MQLYYLHILIYYIEEKIGYAKALKLQIKNIIENYKIIILYQQKKTKKKIITFHK